jgi:hypothetical protein
MPCDGIFMGGAGIVHSSFRTVSCAFAGGNTKDNTIIKIIAFSKIFM